MSRTSRLASARWVGAVVAVVVMGTGGRAWAPGLDTTGLVDCSDHVLCVEEALFCLCTADGRSVRVLLDTNGDGDADAADEYTLDERGRVTVQTGDSDGDGTHDYAWTRTYREDGQVLIEDRDVDADGVVDQRRTHSYDENGFLARVEDDIGLDGVVDMVSVYRFTLDERGLPVRRELDVLADGTVEGRIVWEWDAEGRLVVEGWDNDGDGVAGPAIRYVYDDAGRWTGAQQDVDGDGTYEEACTYAPPCAPCLPRMEPRLCERCRATCEPLEQ